MRDREEREDGTGEISGHKEYISGEGERQKSKLSYGRKSAFHTSLASELGIFGRRRRRRRRKKKNKNKKKSLSATKISKKIRSFIKLSDRDVRDCRCTRYYRPK